MVKDEDVRAAYEAGHLNDYFYDQYNRRAGFYDEPTMDSYFDEAMIMSKIGINNNEDQKIWFYIYTFADKYLEDMVTNRTIPAQMMPAVQAEVFANRDKFPINTHMGHYFALARAAHAVGLSLDKDIEQRLIDSGFIERDRQNVLDIGRRLAYPQDWVGSYTPQPYNIKKWMKATRDIYLRAQRDNSLDNAFNDITKDWDKMEKLDYKHWLRFYQENAQNKYKIAQFEQNNSPNLYGNNLRGNLPSPVMPNIEHHDTSYVADRNDARERIETQRSKIISRLHSAEKLLSSLDGQLFAQDDQEYMLKLLQDLKRKVQTANKISVNSTLFEDFIYRTANYCRSIGKHKASRFFYKVAQAEELDMGGGPGAPPPGGNPDPASMLGDSATPSSMDMDGDGKPDSSSSTPSSGAVEATKEAFKEFFSRLETGISDELSTDHDDDLALDDNGWIVEAQALDRGTIPAVPPGPEPPPTPGPEAPPPVPAPESLEVTEDDVEVTDEIPEDHASNAIKAALEGVTIQDVIARLEVINAMLKQREIARELAIADLELDHLGINAYFPGLGEAHRSALESTQYMATRVEEILSKLKGATTDIPNMVEEQQVAPQAAGVKDSLEKMEQQEEERKRRRREKEDAKMEGAEKPTGAGAQAPTELAGPPPAVEQAPPIPVGR